MNVKRLVQCLAYSVNVTCCFCHHQHYYHHHHHHHVICTFTRFEKYSGLEKLNMRTPGLRGVSCDFSVKLQ